MLKQDVGRVEENLPHPPTCAGARTACDRRERGVFGSAAASINIHGITTSTATPGALLTPDTLAHHAASAAAYQPSGEFALQVLDGHLDQMADAATNSGLALHKLTNVNARLSSATTKQYDTITRLLGDLKLQYDSPNTGDAAHD